MSLDKIFGLYTIGFLGITVLIGIAEVAFGLPNRWIGWIFMALSLLIYVFIGIVTRTSNPDQYYVAGRGVPALYNGMATGSDWMSAASFISMGGALSAQGFAGLAYVMGWTGGYLLLAVFLGPYLRQFGAYTIPDFLGARYGGNAARIIGVIAAVACSFTYLIAQVTGVGLIVSRFIGLDFNIGVFVGLLGVLFCSVLGGMKSVTWTQVAQYIILIVSYLVPVVYLSWTMFTVPIPELTYGRVLQQNNTKAIEITRDAKEKETRALWKKEADEALAKAKTATSDAEAEKFKAQAALASRQATAPAASDDAKLGRYLTVPTGTGMWNFLALTFCLMVGTAGLPHILTRYYTTPSVRQARTSVAWSLFFIFLLYFTAPAYAAFARFTIYAKLVGTKISELPRWVTLWQPAGLFDVVDKNTDGIVQWADFVVKSTDFVVLSMPEIAGLPFVITGLVMAGGLAAALSTADGLLLTIANAISHDLYYNVIDHSASLTRRLTITKVFLIVTALIAAWVATFRVAIIVELVAWAFSLAGASFFPALVMGIWWKRANKAGAVAGMAAGLLITTYYMIGSRFYGVSWWGTQTIASAIFGLPVGFIVIWLVSLMTPPPPQAVQDLVVSVRYPKSGQATKGDPLGRGVVVAH
ncbi:MAG TPA: sodium:solute symporter family protein [Methylomirabilota bacterium]|jgi:cation/acetate symporter|nr:sodium:solute symporter family protein [Methylomirabilota bacterium]